MTIPTSASLNPCPTIIPMISCACAPKVMRMPISGTRWVTEYIIRPYNPTTESSSAHAAKIPSNRVRKRCSFTELAMFSCMVRILTAWAAVRNASDPQMDTQGLTPKEVRAKAGQIYEKFGYWTTVSSAIACWELVLDN